jgi:RimJ/RimL family protein N-acetyltransferase
VATSPLPQIWREVPTLVGQHVRLVPLTMEHAEGLRAARDDVALDDLWFANLPQRDCIHAFIEKALDMQAKGECLSFTVLDSAGKVVGTTRLYSLDASIPRAWVGYTWYAPRVWRTAINTEAKLLLLGYAFEVLNCISVGFETSSHNARSRAAIMRVGAKQDGILRNHKRHGDGSPRDTVAFSIIDSEWPQVKQNLLTKLNLNQ